MRHLPAGKAETIRHKGKKLKDILDAHEKFHKGYPGGERADLSGADLSKADLKKRDLTGANLAGSNLRKADLRGAKLSHADLSRADMRQADLRNCDFTETRLEGADLSEADLSGTELFRGDLRSAKAAQDDLAGNRPAAGQPSWRGFFGLGPGARQLPRNRSDRREVGRRGPERCRGPRQPKELRQVGQASEPVWQQRNPCRARLQPCRKACKFSTALAAGLFGAELPHRLFSVCG